MGLRLGVTRPSASETEPMADGRPAIDRSRVPSNVAVPPSPYILALPGSAGLPLPPVRSTSRWMGESDGCLLLLRPGDVEWGVLHSEGAPPLGRCTPP